jgi:1-phosphatidylinositol phosphodiesterase
MLSFTILWGQPSQADDVILDWSDRSNGTAYMSFAVEGFSSTNKCTGPTSSGFYGVPLTISINCSRSGSSNVASIFNGYLYGASPYVKNIGQATAWYQTYGTAELAATGSSSDTAMNPGSLNWVVRGALNIGADSYQVVLGQGHDSFHDRNNWWIGGPDLTGFAANGVMVTLDGKYQIGIGPNDYTFLINMNPWAYPEWMKTVPDSTQLGRTSMPGTHDAGTYAYRPAWDTTAVQTQYHTIRGQLASGIRVFDIRLTDSLQITHHSYPMELWLSDVLQQSKDFLDAHPSETVVLMLKHDQGGQIAPELLSNTMSMIPESGYWMDNSTMPTLGQVRGKIVIISRVDSDADNNVPAGDSPIGIAITGWPDSTTGMSYAGGISFLIQDNYNGPSLNEKITDVQNLVTEANLGYNLSYWPINYLSYAGTSDTLPTIARDMTASMMGFFASPPDGTSTFGTTMLDFAGVDVWNEENMTVLGAENLYGREIAHSVISQNVLDLAESATVSFTSNGTNQVSPSTAASASSSVDAVDEDKIESESPSIATSGGGLRKDKYTIHASFAYDPQTFNLQESLSDDSCFSFRIASHEISRCMREGRAVDYGRGISGRVFRAEGKETLLVRWTKSRITFDVRSNLPGKNLIDLTGKNGTVTGSFEIAHRLHGTGVECTVPYSGRAVKKLNQRTGVEKYTWTINSHVRKNNCTN